MKIDTAIIGGGISGLSAAYYLSKRGVPCTIFEPRHRLGGVIETQHIDGCVVEGGPDSWLAAKPAALELIRELGLADQVIGSNDSQRRIYIRKNGKLVAMPEGLQMIAPTRIGPILRTSLLGPATKIRMAREFFRRPSKNPDRSVADFALDHFGEEAVEYLAEPLLSGVYGGDCRLLSVESVLPRFVEFERKYGSVTKGVLASPKPAGALFQTLKGGLGQLTQALSAAIEGKARIVECRVETIERDGEGYRLKAGGDWLSTKSLIVACGAQQAAPALEPLDAEMAALLRTIPYASSVVIALGFHRQKVKHPLNGFGFLVPRRERGLVMACTWVDRKFEHRAPPDYTLMRCFVGGDTPRGDAEITRLVLEELRAILGIDAEPAFSRVFRWPEAMAQYTVGHRRRLAELESRAARWPGLHLIGNGFQGIGIPDCIRLAKEAVEQQKSPASGDAGRD